METNYLVIYSDSVNKHNEPIFKTFIITQIDMIEAIKDLKTVFGIHYKSIYQITVIS